MIRLTIDMPRWVWWLALRFGLAIALEVEGQKVAPSDLLQHGRPLILVYSAGADGEKERRRSQRVPGALQTALAGDPEPASP